jgi:hypothetical protein
MGQLRTRTEKIIDVHDFDKLVQNTYGKQYSYQQQDGCRSRGMYPLCVPNESEDIDRDVIPEEINGSEMGVSFSAWLLRDVEKSVGPYKDEWYIELFWERNFYPDVQMIANDLHVKGLIKSGSYLIDVD